METVLDTKTIKDLLSNAMNVANTNFCCKYSNFTVGAALLTKEGRIITGFNVENHGIQSICAERTAFVKALSEGYKEFVAIAVVGKHIGDKYFEKTLPCGYCRQFMSEYTNKEFPIYAYDEETQTVTEYKLKELLPESFRG